MIETRALSLPSVLAQHAVWSPQAEAVVCGKERLTWGELVRRVHQVANALLRGGLVKGDRVAMLLDNSIEFLEVMLGTISAGGVVVPLSKLASDDALSRMVADAGAAFLLVDNDARERADLIRGSQGCIGQHGFIVIGEAGGGWTAYRPWRDEASEAAPHVEHRFEDTISILYTSGTTGSPKGMEHTHFSRLLYPLCLGRRFKIEASSRVILVTPMYHNGTWTTMLPALYFGACIIILERFRAQNFARTVEQERCTTAFMVPTQLNVLAGLDDLNWSAFRSMRLIMVSGAPLSAQTFQEIRRRLPSLELCQIYGMGEGFMTFVSTEDYERGKDGSVGRPMIEVDTDIQIIGDDDRPVSPYEVGEIVGTSAFLLRSYWANPELTERAIWRNAEGRSYLRSGDLGRFDSDGYLYIAGRKKDVIISGGVKIYSADVENIFAQHEQVQEAAVVGVPDPKWGETPVLFAILKPQASVTAAELRDWGNARLGKTQRVSSVEIRTSFPRNSLGKVVKGQLADEHLVGRSSASRVNGR